VRWARGQGAFAVAAIQHVVPGPVEGVAGAAVVVGVGRVETGSVGGDVAQPPAVEHPGRLVEVQRQRGRGGVGGAGVGE
jgi:hypothetical protein